MIRIYNLRWFSALVVLLEILDPLLYWSGLARTAFAYKDEFHNFPFNNHSG